MAAERRAVRGQHQVHLQRRDAVERGQEFPQRVVIGLPADVGRDVLQDMIAGEKHTPLRLVEADVAGRVARSPDHLEVADGGRDRLASRQRDDRDPDGRRSSESPRAMTPSPRSFPRCTPADVRTRCWKSRLFSKSARSASSRASAWCSIRRAPLQRGDLAHQPHMIGVDMREQNRADIGPRDAHALARAVERVEAGLRIHTGIDEHPAVGEADEVDVDQTEGKRKRQFQDVDARKHLPVIPADLQVGGQWPIVLFRGQAAKARCRNFTRALSQAGSGLSFD